MSGQTYTRRTPNRNPAHGRVRGVQEGNGMTQLTRVGPGGVEPPTSRLSATRYESGRVVVHSEFPPAHTSRHFRDEKKTALFSSRKRTQRVHGKATPVPNSDAISLASDSICAISAIRCCGREVASLDDGEWSRRRDVQPRWETTIERPRTVGLEYRDASFELRRVTLGGFSARCAAHECDHLDGKLIVDGLSRQQRRQAERFTAKHRTDGVS
jgi:hypothetical protein